MVWTLGNSIFRTSFYRIISILVLPITTRFISTSNTLFVVLLLSGWLLEVWLYWIAPCFKRYFSIAEVVLYPKWFLFLLFLLLTPSTPLSTRVAFTVVLLSVLLTTTVLIVHAYIPLLRHSPLLLYGLIILGAAVEIQTLSLVVNCPFIPWFIQWIFQVQGDWESFSFKRIGLLGYWAVCLTLFFILLQSGLGSSQKIILQRKYFHYLCIVLFVPGIVLDPSFMRFDWLFALFDL